MLIIHFKLYNRQFEVYNRQFEVPIVHFKLYNRQFEVHNRQFKVSKLKNKNNIYVALSRFRIPVQIINCNVKQIYT